MSNYYISKCCGEQVDINDQCHFFCQGCKKECEVTAVIDSPGGVPEEDKTEQIRDWEKELWKLTEAEQLGNVIVSRTPLCFELAKGFIMKLLSEQRQSIGVSEWMKIGKERGFHDYWKDMTRIALIKEIEKLSKELETIDIRDILKKLK